MCFVSEITQLKIVQRYTDRDWRDENMPKMLQLSAERTWREEIKGIKTRFWVVCLQRETKVGERIGETIKKMQLWYQTWFKV